MILLISGMKISISYTGKLKCGSLIGTWSLNNWNIHSIRKRVVDIQPKIFFCYSNKILVFSTKLFVKSTKSFVERTKILLGQQKNL